MINDIASHIWEMLKSVCSPDDLIIDMIDYQTLVRVTHSPSGLVVDCKAYPTAEENAHEVIAALLVLLPSNLLMYKVSVHRDYGVPVSSD